MHKCDYLLGCHSLFALQYNTSKHLEDKEKREALQKDLLENKNACLVLLQGDTITPTLCHRSAEDICKFMPATFSGKGVCPLWNEAVARNPEGFLQRCEKCITHTTKLMETYDTYEKNVSGTFEDICKINKEKNNGNTSSGRQQSQIYRQLKRMGKP